MRGKNPRNYATGYGEAGLFPSRVKAPPRAWSSLRVEELSALAAWQMGRDVRFGGFEVVTSRYRPQPNQPQSSLYLYGGLRRRFLSSSTRPHRNEPHEMRGTGDGAAHVGMVISKMRCRYQYPGCELFGKRRRILPWFSLERWVDNGPPAL